MSTAVASRAVHSSAVESLPDGLTSTRPRRIRRALFVTGTPRCGSTFIGSALARERRVAYLHEPFNGRSGIRPIDWTSESRLDKSLDPLSEPARQAIDRLFDLRIKLGKSPTAKGPLLLRTFKRWIGGRGPVYLAGAKLNPRTDHAVIKEPVGWCWMSYLTRHYPVTPLLILRHPVAQWSSYRRLGWRPHLGRFRRIDGLDALLTNEDRRLRDTEPASDAACFAVGWRLAYRCALAMLQQVSGVVTTHEAISQDPPARLRELAEALDWPFGHRSGEWCKARSGKGNQTEATSCHRQDLQRRSDAILASSLAAVPADERDVIEELTGTLAEHYYSVSREAHGIVEQVNHCFTTGWFQAIPRGTHHVHRDSLFFKP